MFNQKDELVLSYAVFLLRDVKLEILEEKLNKVITASGNSVEAYWPGLFAKALWVKDISARLSNAGSTSSGLASFAVATSAAKVNVDMGDLFGYWSSQLRIHLITFLTNKNEKYVGNNKNQNPKDDPSIKRWWLGTKISLVLCDWFKTILIYWNLKPVILKI